MFILLIKQINNSKKHQEPISSTPHPPKPVTINPEISCLPPGRKDPSGTSMQFGPTKLIQSLEFLEGIQEQQNQEASGWLVGMCLYI